MPFNKVLDLRQDKLKQLHDKLDSNTASNHYKNTYPVLGNKILHHPALKRALSGKHLPLAGHRLSCATPDYAALVLEIARYLHKEAL